ncbi:MAG: N-acetylmuramoyl-L-alanine amidase [Myxococcales bacterium]|nr:N-acetylmuramoyl-L-alanine amidase [Myxococcales bacterium]
MIGPTGLREKDVTIAIAKMVGRSAARARRRGAPHARQRRVSCPRERAAVGNAFEADVFVSIHYNAAETKARRGTETYVLDTPRDDSPTASPSARTAAAGEPRRAPRDPGRPQDRRGRRALAPPRDAAAEGHHVVAARRGEGRQLRRRARRRRARRRVLRARRRACPPCSWRCRSSRTRSRRATSPRPTTGRGW